MARPARGDRVRSVMSRFLDRRVLGDAPRRRLWFARRMPDWYIRRVQLSDFRSTIDLAARRSTFYRRRFAEIGIDPSTVRCPADLGDLFTTSEDLLSHPVEEFLCERAQAGFETTGTSSPRRKRVSFSTREMDEMGRDGAAGLWSLGVRPTDRMVSTLDLPFWNAGPAIRTAARFLGCFLVEAGMISPRQFYEQASGYRFTVLVAEPSWLVSLTELAAQAGTWPVKLMLAGGEHMTEKARRFVEETWKTDVYLTYGQTESFGGAGTECVHKNGYHLNEMKFWFEIPEPDDHGDGELVLTTLSRTVMPLLRYRTSDVTRFLPQACDCDFSALRRISKIAGRCDEMVNCGLGHVSPWIIEQILDDVEGLGPDWQVVVSRPGLRDMIELYVEPRPDVPEEEIEKQVLLSLRKRFPEMARYLWMGLCDLRIKTSLTGTLRMGRKLRTVVDRRGVSRAPDSGPRIAQG